ncbi:hypothetical protein LSTR_LSTR000364 [Laodelphax striatellus]|uniref:Peptidase metallopeptidase domain-containing protein n=1 Tax=Laodelphax striatellus TaxID=195883 RepID=A0A482X3K0_LAOST|nr:hypothetical protein LSTR_LSTR000364 [Laodelphax striatellus]
MGVLKSVIISSQVYLFMCLVCVNVFTSAQFVIDKGNGFSTDDAVDFMKKFGYLRSDSDGPQALIDPNSMSDALKNVQSFGGIPETGILDEATIKLMQTPRCGVPDILPSNRKKREIPWTNGWNKAVITYFVGDTFKISRDLARIEIKEAFDKWEKYSRLKFLEVSDKEKADIVILFQSRSHGDGFPFDGKGHVLAHAFSPSDYHGLSGDIHFDNDENWAVNSNRYDITDFFSVAIHEIGHSLGFYHTKNEKSVMHSSYQVQNKRTFQFTEDIIRGLYEMYLLNRKIDWSSSYTPSTTFRPRTQWPSTTTRMRTRPTVEPVTPRTSTVVPVTPRTSTISYENDSETVEKHMKHDCSHKIPEKVDPVMHCEKEVPSTPPDFCSGNFDSVANIRGELFIFKQGYVYRLKGRGQPYGEPKEYQFSFFRNKTSPMLNCMDAVYERPNDNRFVIFTGAWYWVLDDLMNILENSPQPITNYGLSQYVTKIDAAMVKDGKTYLFANGKYWRYDDKKSKLDEGYPRPMSFFLGLPSKIDAAFTWNDNITYFFKENRFWSLNSTWKRVENLHGLTASKFWLNCDR